MDWSNQQEEALSRVSNWLRCEDRQVFRLFGYAGTGKTTLAQEIAANAGGRVMFAAYTGKAANVLRERGCDEATTIHRLIYLPSDRSKVHLRTLQQDLAKVPEGNTEKRNELLARIREEEQRLQQPAFSLNPDSEIRAASLVIIDECSMVDQRLGEDLLSFDVPVLVLGDPAQLPPVRGAGFFTSQKPDYTLTEIHRQARDNPIIDLATRIRTGSPIQAGRYGESAVLDDRPDPDQVLRADQVLVGRNKTRRQCNTKMRRLLGYGESLPEPGDKLVCLRNNHELGLLNGTLWSVRQAAALDDDKVMLGLVDDQGTEVSTTAHAHHFQGRDEDLPYWMKKEAEEFDYGYALTTHKAQGSQWDDVLVFDESRCFGSNARNWLYTAVTRAAERVTIVRR